MVGNLPKIEARLEKRMLELSKGLVYCHVLIWR
jgi:hypothetical protein